MSVCQIYEISAVFSAIDFNNISVLHSAEKVFNSFHTLFNHILGVCGVSNKAKNFNKYEFGCILKNCRSAEKTLEFAKFLRFFILFLNVVQF